MSEIIGIHIGSAGIGIGKSFWEIVSEEHEINPDGTLPKNSAKPKGFSNIAFNEPEKSTQQKARAIFFDQNSKSIDSINASKFSKLFDSDSLVKGKSSNSGENISLWAEGFHGSTASENVDIIFEKLRTMVEKADRTPCFQLTFSLSGGTGSGFGSKFLSNLCIEFSNKPNIFTNNVFLSPSTSENVIEVFNTVLSIHHLVEYSSFTTIFTNEAINRLLSKKMYLFKPTFDDTNFLLGRYISNLTSCNRFSGPLNSSTLKMATNLVMFPRLHFLINGLSPIKKKIEKHSQIESIIKDSYKRKNMFFTADFSSNSNIISEAYIFRGDWHKSFVERNLKENINKKQQIEWISDNQHQMFDDNLNENNMTQIINSTTLQHYLYKIDEKFAPMFRRKAFLHHYTSLGMDEMEFAEAESNMNDLRCEYQQYETYGHEDFDG